MNKLHFEHFTFDPASLVLTANKNTVTLRPKTAELLRELIVGRHRVISKRELISRIWHTEHVTDQSVFQAMSELRAALAPLVAIKTFPNKGYQWVTEVRQPKPKHIQYRLAIAASVVAGIVGVFIAGSVTPANDPNSVHMHSGSVTTLPALVAFGEGASALQRGATQQAVELLELSVIERPDFVEAQLLLSEAYLQHGDALKGREIADNVMSALDASVNAYSLIAAMDLLSRADQQLGQYNSALEWATRAADQANTDGFECTAADLHDRVLALVQEHPQSSLELQASPVFASAFVREMLRSAGIGDADLASSAPSMSYSPSNGVADSSDEWPADRALGLVARQPIPGERPAHCERLRGAPSGSLSPFSDLSNSLALEDLRGKESRNPLT